MAKKKLIALITVLVCVLSMSVGATVAYITSVAGPVKNTFTVGDIELTLGETTGATYQLIPGTTVKKDPRVTVVGGSEDCWLFIKLTKTENPDHYLTYSISDGWYSLHGFADVYYREVKNVDGDLSFQILRDDEITVKDTLTKEEIGKITSNPRIAFTAYAIQSYGIDDAATAYNAILEEE